MARAKKYAWLGQAKCDPHDLVNEAIAQAYGVGSKGSFRKWNKERYPDPVDFFISTINSITSHDAKHYTRFRQEHFGGQESGSPDPLETEASKSLSSIHKALDPEEKTIQLDLAQKSIASIRELINGDEEMGMIFLCLEEGITKAKDIAKETGYDINRVYTILRRYRRKLKEIDPSLRSN